MSHQDVNIPQDSVASNLEGIESMTSYEYSKLLLYVSENSSICVLDVVPFLDAKWSICRTSLLQDKLGKLHTEKMGRNGSFGVVCPYHNKRERVRERETQQIIQRERETQQIIQK